VPKNSVAIFGLYPLLFYFASESVIIKRDKFKLDSVKIMQRQIIKKVKRNSEYDGEYINAEPSEFFSAVWPITMNAWAFKGEDFIKQPLQRDVTRLIKNKKATGRAKDLLDIESLKSKNLRPLRELIFTARKAKKACIIEGHLTQLPSIVSQILKSRIRCPGTVKTPVLYDFS